RLPGGYRAGRLVRTSAILFRAASNIVDRRARIARLGTARLRFRQRGASPWRESLLSTNRTGGTKVQLKPVVRR
ncbi:unnamed protein product, partial [Nesidiocoris tenuis]